MNCFRHLFLPLLLLLALLVSAQTTPTDDYSSSEDEPESIVVDHEEPDGPPMQAELTESHFHKDGVDDPITVGVAVLMALMVVLPLFALIYNKVDPGLGAYLIMGLFNLPVLAIDILTLKHLRRLINRFRYRGLSVEPSPYLPMMGGLTETHLLRRQIRPFHTCMDGRLWKAMIWRMVAHGDLSIVSGPGGSQLMISTWHGGCGDGMDSKVMQYMSTILSARTDSHSHSITPRSTSKALYGKVMRKGDNDPLSTNAAKSAEKLMYLLRSNVKLNDRKKEPIRQIFGFRRYLKHIKTDAAPQFDLSRLWGEYVAFACLFGMEKQVLRDVLQLLREKGQLSGITMQLDSNPSNVRMVESVARSASRASFAVTIHGIRNSGLLPFARGLHEHLDQPLS